MVAAKAFSRRSLIAILLIMAVLLLLFSSAHYFTLETLSANVSLLAQSDELLPEHMVLVDQYDRIRATAGTYFVPAAALVLILAGLLLWAIVRWLFRTLSARESLESAAAGRAASPPAEAREVDRSERLFLHLISVLQREGRLIDFFSEDLSPYDDSQIGAAVRTIHESCNKTMGKYLALEPVVLSAEGESYSVPTGFDPAAIKLTGNVAGEPPFEGIVRHKGWRAGRLDVPTLSGSRDDRIIAPAEIEIL